MAAPTALTEQHDTPEASGVLYSIVVPVFNSEQIVGTTIDAIVQTFTDAGLRYELILVEDGSSDNSWQVVAQKAEEHPGVVAIRLLRNYGQHHANLAGLRATTGDYVITMDDDLQNPPDQALLLIDTALAGHDVVYGKFEAKQHSGIRRIGSAMISMINRRIFGQPPGLTVSNFRILRRDVVDRICASRTAHPYLTGQSLMYSYNRANVQVKHQARTVGSSNYNLLRILRLVMTILFSYSSFPLRLGALLGFAIAGISLVLGGVYLVTGLINNDRVPGWTTVVVMLAVLNGFTIALLSMLGEYVVRTLNTVSDQFPYHVAERIE